MRHSRETSPYLTSFTVVFSAFVVANYLYYSRVPACGGCLVRNGWPFAFVETGDYVRVDHILWLGAVGDLAVLFTAAILMSQASRYVHQRLRNSKRQDF